MYLLIIFLINIFSFQGKECCVQLKAKWHENGVSIALSVRPRGVKDFVDIVESDNLIKNVSSIH